jgi:hypothetical protein
MNDPLSWSSIEITVDLSILLERMRKEEEEDVDPSVEPQRTVHRILDEARWRFALVKKVPVKLKISFVNIEDDLNYNCVRIHLIFHWIQGLLRTIFWSASTVKLRSYQEELHLPPFHRLRSFFNDIFPLMQPAQYRNVTSLSIVNPELQGPVVFPNLKELRITRDLDVLTTLSKITSMSLRTLTLAGGTMGRRNHGLRLAPLLLRHQSLESVNLQASLWSNMLPSQIVDPDQYRHPSVTRLYIYDSYQSSTFQVGWQLTPFLWAFPYLTFIGIAVIGSGSYDTTETDVVVAEKMTTAVFVGGQLPLELVLGALWAFPNLQTLCICANEKSNHERPDYGAALFALLAMEEIDAIGIKVPSYSPYLRSIELGRILLDKDTILALADCIKSRHIPWAGVPSATEAASGCRIALTKCQAQWDEADPLPHELGAMNLLAWPEFRDEIFKTFIRDRICLAPEEIDQQLGSLPGDFYRR